MTQSKQWPEVAQSAGLDPDFDSEPELFERQASAKDARSIMGRMQLNFETYFAGTATVAGDAEEG
jgi:hypothetical protein